MEGRLCIGYLWQYLSCIFRSFWKLVFSILIDSVLISSIRFYQQLLLLSFFTLLIPSFCFADKASAQFLAFSLFTYIKLFIAYHFLLLRLCTFSYQISLESISKSDLDLNYPQKASYHSRRRFHQKYLLYCN